MNTDVQDVIKALGEALKKPIPEALIKAWTQSASPTTGITAYDLEAPAKQLVPVLTPLRNEIPRVGGGVGTATNWKSITAINTNLLEIGVSEGNRGGIMAHTATDSLAAYKGLGLEDNVTFEAEYAGQSFDDVKALAVMGLLNSMMIGEEQVILGGNTSLALGTTPTPTLVGSASGGSLATAAAYSVICVALTQAGYYSGSVAGGIRASVSRVSAGPLSNTDTYGGGSAQKSANATVVVPTGAVGSISASVAHVNGAVGYAWFWAATTGSELLGAITTLNSVVIKATATGTQTASSLPSSDNSKNTLVYDGILTQVFTSGSNSYIKVMANGTAGIGTALTSDNAGGIVELDDALQVFWDDYRLSPDTIWLNSREQKDLTKKIMAAPSTSAQRFVFDVKQGNIMGGSLALSYLNKFGLSAGNEYGQGKEIAFKIHPNIPPGTMLFTTRKLPYKLNNVANVLQVKTRRDYYQLEWPLISRRYDYGVYMDGVLQNYFPPAFGVITNIGTG